MKYGPGGSPFFRRGRARGAGTTATAGTTGTCVRVGGKHGVSGRLMKRSKRDKETTDYYGSMLQASSLLIQEEETSFQIKRCDDNCDIS